MTTPIPYPMNLLSARLVSLHRAIVRKKILTWTRLNSIKQTVLKRMFEKNTFNSVLMWKQLKVKTKHARQTYFFLTARQFTLYLYNLIRERYSCEFLYTTKKQAIKQERAGLRKDARRDLSEVKTLKRELTKCLCSRLNSA